MAYSNILNDELVSVIIPVYNVEKYITETIDSVLKQTYKNIEIIIVDDKSTDSTKQLISLYEKKYNNIHCIYLEVNHGMAAFARNQGVNASKGRYIAFLDGDDSWEVEKIEEQVKCLMMNSSALCYTSINFIDECGKFVKNQKVPDTVDFKFLLKNTVIATSSVIIDTKITGKVEMPLRRTGEDYILWLQILKKNGNAIGINKGLTNYRRRNNSLSANKLDSIKDIWYAQYKVYKLNSIVVCINIIYFAFYAIKKHYI